MALIFRKALLVPADAVPTLLLACLFTGFFCFWCGYWSCFFENGPENEVCNAFSDANYSICPSHTRMLNRILRLPTVRSAKQQHWRLVPTTAFTQLQGHASAAPKRLSSSETTTQIARIATRTHSHAVAGAGG